MRISPIGRDQANAYIRENHRHHGSTQGFKFAIAAVDEFGIAGVCIVGRPVNRNLDDGLTLEVRRLCTVGLSNACSFLYGAARRIAREMGYRRILTYINASEPGTSLRAAGWKKDGVTKGRSWNCHSRPREDKTEIVDRVRYVSEFNSVNKVIPLLTEESQA